jgi:hypothetical protein
LPIARLQRHAVAPASVLLCVACALGAGGRQSAAAVLPPTVKLRAQYVGFYAGHLVLDGRGRASLDDGVLRVSADRIIVDLRAERYVAAGSVTVAGLTAAHGDALEVDLTTRRGILVDAASQPPDILIDGAAVGGPVTIGADEEPLALPDVGFETPYIRASAAVAHVGADVRLTNAHIIVPGGESVGLPSFVYTFSTDPGYSTTNVPTNGEDVPIYFGSSPVSIQGIHFSYNSITKVAVGLSNNFVFGNKAYVLLAAAPIYGPTRGLSGTWQELINDHTSQTLTSTTFSAVGTQNTYDLRDAIHRSYLELTADQGLGFHGAQLAWQSFNQNIGNPQAANLPYFYLRSEFGYTHVPTQTPFAPFPVTAVLPRTVWHNAVAGYLGTPTWNWGPNASLYGSAQLQAETDSLPHRQVSQIYTLTLSTHWSRKITVSYSDTFNPFFDAYPSERTIYHSRLTLQGLTFSYNNGDPFQLTLTLSRGTVASDNPAPPFAYPWTLSGDFRFRVTRTLSLDLSREYFFGYLGQRFGSLGLQILP